MKPRQYILDEQDRPKAEQMKITTSTQNNIEKIVQLINGGIEQWIEAGKMVAKEIDNDPDFVDKFCDRVTSISPEVVRRFEQIGRNLSILQTLIQPTGCHGHR